MIDFQTAKPFPSGCRESTASVDEGMVGYETDQIWGRGEEYGSVQLITMSFFCNVMYLDVFLVCMKVCVPGTHGGQKSIRFSGTRITVIVSYRVGAGVQTWILWPSLLGNGGTPL